MHVRVCTQPGRETDWTGVLAEFRLALQMVRGAFLRLLMAIAKSRGSTKIH